MVLSVSTLECCSNDGDAAWIDAAVLEMTIHDVGDRHSRVEVVHHEGAARAAPARDAPASDVGPVDLDQRWILERVAQAPPNVKSEDSIRAVGLDLESPFAAGSREQ